MTEQVGADLMDNRTLRTIDITSNYLKNCLCILVFQF